MSGQRTRRVQPQHQRSSSTGSHGLLFGIGAAAGHHHGVINQHHGLLSTQMSSPDLVTSDEEESEELDIKGFSCTALEMQSASITCLLNCRYFEQVDKLHTRLARSFFRSQGGHACVLQVSIGDGLWLSWCHHCRQGKPHIAHLCI